MPIRRLSRVPAAILPPSSVRAAATGVVLVYRTPWVVARRCRLVAAAEHAATGSGVCESYFFYNINIGDLLTPMFQQAPMLPVFDVRCVHGRILPLMSLLGVHAVAVVNAVTRSLQSTERSRPVRI